MNVHGTAGGRGGQSYAIVDKLKRDMTALGFDIGLA